MYNCTHCNCLHGSRFIRVSVSSFFCINLVKSKFGTMRILWSFHCFPNNLKYIACTHRLLSLAILSILLLLFFFRC